VSHPTRAKPIRVLCRRPRARPKDLAEVLIVL
jgi:hypothetical protein